VNNEEWESLTSAERAARTYHYAALASPPSAIERKLIPFCMALYEAFDTLTRQDAVKNHNDPLPDPPPPFTITQRDWDTLMLKLDKLICAVLNTTEAIEEGQRPEEVEQNA
jgi:hypothetical protein